MRMCSLARFGCLAAGAALLAGSAHATVPGANGIIAYVRDGAIWSMNADGTHRTKLTTASGFQDPVWSPDGSKIAFSTGTQVAVMNADGSGIKRIAEGRIPTWSPDGKRLAYTCGAGFGQICAAGVSGGGVATLTRSAGRSPTWSPDGKSIGYECTTSNGADSNLCAVAPDGTALRNLTSTRGDLHLLPDWSPNGKEILFELGTKTATGTNLKGIYALNLATQQVRQVAGNSYAHYAHWSPDGKKIVAWTRPAGGTSIMAVASSGGPGPSTSLGPGEDATWGSPTLRVRSVAIRGAWSESILGGVIFVSGDSRRSGTLRAQLVPLRAGPRRRASTLIVPFPSGSFRRTVPAPKTLTPGRYVLKAVPASFTVDVGSSTVTVSAPPEGIVDSAYVSAVQGGPPVTSLPHTNDELWANFHFAYQPNASRSLTAQWIAPGGAPAAAPVGKPPASTVVSFIKSENLRPGVWQCVLRAGGRVVKRATVRIG